MRCSYRETQPKVRPRGLVARARRSAAAPPRNAGDRRRAATPRDIRRTPTADPLTEVPLAVNRPSIVVPGPGQESAWDYPRPPRVEAVPELIRVVVDGVPIADSRRALRVLETSHPPSYYLPPEDVRLDLLEASPRTSMCEFKGRATYLTLVLPAGRRVADVAWRYPDPAPGFEAIAGHLSFYASRVDEAWVGAERVVPQAGDFYGGWITSRVVGPFKGGPGTWGW